MRLRFYSAPRLLLVARAMRRATEDNTRPATAIRLARDNACGLAIADDSFAVNPRGHLLQGRYNVEKHAQRRMLRVAAQLCFGPAG